MSHSGELLQGLYRRRFKHRPQLQRLARVELHCILEQIPDPESRVTLSERKKDALGMPLSKIDWKISETERHTARRMTQLVCEEFGRLGLPAPRIQPGLDEHSAWVSNCVEKAHPTGTTRMSNSPKQGVVDTNCQVHGVEGLFVSGSSVFPTSGAANPTLMIVAGALRLADWLKARYVAQRF
jgi:choline dehydrogenase-like flavoprotein